MRRLPSLTNVLSLLLAGAVLAPVVALATPPHAVCAGPGNQLSPTIVTDGAGGAILAWVDTRDATANLFCRRVLASGAADRAWPTNGRALRTDPSSLAGETEDPAFPVSVPDGAGGAIVAWQDSRTRATQTDLYVQHIRASGEVDPAWPANGTALCAAPGVQHALALVPDGAGGAIATWMDERFGPGRADLYAQHVLASGAADPRWPRDGLAVSVAPGPQEFPAMVEDGAGGAIITWYDLRVVANGFDIYAQHVLASGAVDPAWPAGGRALCTAYGDQVDASIASDGAHGAIVAWSDNRRGADHPFAQHLLASGAVDGAWPYDGRAISNNGFAEEFPKVVADGTGGAILTWQTRGEHVNMFAQHLVAGGVVDASWPAGGRALSVTNTEQASGAIVPDGAGGAIVAWQDEGGILAQHVLVSGALDPGYPETGRPLCAGEEELGPPALVATGSGGAIATWPSSRDGMETDLYAAQVRAVDAAPGASGTTSAPGAASGGAMRPASSP